MSHFTAFYGLTDLWQSICLYKIKLRLGGRGGREDVDVDVMMGDKMDNASCHFSEIKRGGRNISGVRRGYDERSNVIERLVL